MKKILLSAVLAYTLTGCVVVDTLTLSDWELQEQSNRKDIARLQLGTSVEDILSTMGSPQFNELMTHREEKVQVLYYRTNRVRGDGNTTKDECTPLLFVNGKLQGWGNNVVNQIVNNAGILIDGESLIDVESLIDRKSLVSTEQAG